MFAFTMRRSRSSKAGCLFHQMMYWRIMLASSLWVAWSVPWSGSGTCRELGLWFNQEGHVGVWTIAASFAVGPVSDRSVFGGVRCGLNLAGARRHQGPNSWVTPARPAFS